MPSPFPGMNPYLERPGVWHGFHTTYLVEMQRALVAQVSPRYICKTQESLFIDAEPDDLQSHRVRKVAEGDALVARRATGARPNGSNGHGSAAAAASAAVLEAPAAVGLPQPRLRRKHRWLELRDRDGMALVTLIELLSPANKRPGRDRRQYERKRLRVIDAGVNFVELDLLRRGPRLPLTGLPPCDYYALVSRPDEWPDAGLWPLALRDPLATIPIPLRPADADARLDRAAGCGGRCADRLRRLRRGGRRSRRVDPWSSEG